MSIQATLCDLGIIGASHLDPALHGWQRHLGGQERAHHPQVAEVVGRLGIGVALGLGACGDGGALLASGQGHGDVTTCSNN